MSITDKVLELTSKVREAIPHLSSSFRQVDSPHCGVVRSMHWLLGMSEFKMPELNGCEEYEESLVLVVLAGVVLAACSIIALLIVVSGRGCPELCCQQGKGFCGGKVPSSGCCGKRSEYGYSVGSVNFALVLAVAWTAALGFSTGIAFKGNDEVSSTVAPSVAYLASTAPADLLTIASVNATLLALSPPPDKAQRLHRLMQAAGATAQAQRVHFHTAAQAAEHYNKLRLRSLGVLLVVVLMIGALAVIGRLVDKLFYVLIPLNYILLALLLVTAATEAAATMAHADMCGVQNTTSLGDYFGQAVPCASSQVDTYGELHAELASWQNASSRWACLALRGLCTGQRRSPPTASVVQGTCAAAAACLASPSAANWVVGHSAMQLHVVSSGGGNATLNQCASAEQCLRGSSLQRWSANYSHSALHLALLSEASRALAPLVKCGMWRHRLDYFVALQCPTTTGAQDLLLGGMALQCTSLLLGCSILLYVSKRFTHKYRAQHWQFQEVTVTSEMFKEGAFSMFLCEKEQGRAVVHLVLPACPDGHWWPVSRKEDEDTMQTTKARLKALNVDVEIVEEFLRHNEGNNMLPEQMKQFLMHYKTELAEEEEEELHERQAAMNGSIDEWQAQRGPRQGTYWQAQRGRVRDADGEDTAEGFWGNGEDNAEGFGGNVEDVQIEIPHVHIAEESSESVEMRELASEVPHGIPTALGSTPANIVDLRKGVDRCERDHRNRDTPRTKSALEEARRALDEAQKAGVPRTAIFGSMPGGYPANATEARSNDVDFETFNPIRENAIRVVSSFHDGGSLHLGEDLLPASPSSSDDQRGARFVNLRATT